MIAELRNCNDKLAVYTDSTELERRLKRLKSCLYYTPYYDSHNGKIVGVDLYFDKSAKSMLNKITSSLQLPLF